MRNRVIIAGCAGVLASFSCSMSSFAALSGDLTLKDSTGTSTSVSIDASRNFVVKTFFTSSLATIGLDYYLNSITQNGTGTAFTNAFKILSRTTGSVYTDPAPTDSFFANRFLNLATPDHNGFSVVDPIGSPAAANPASPYLVATYNINVAASVPNGLYTLTLTEATPPDGGFTDTSNGTHTFTTLGSVTVAVPEPLGGASLLVIAGASLVGRRRRSRSTIAAGSSL
jgi:hypothetical protein